MKNADEKTLRSVIRLMRREADGYSNERERAQQDPDLDDQVRKNLVFGAAKAACALRVVVERLMLEIARMRVNAK